MDGEANSYIITKMPKETLKDFVSNLTQSLPIEVIVSIIYKLGRTIQKLHKLRIIHRDICLENI